jgi:hypothetical protein
MMPLSLGRLTDTTVPRASFFATVRYTTSEIRRYGHFPLEGGAFVGLREGS